THTRSPTFRPIIRQGPWSGVGESFRRLGLHPSACATHFHTPRQQPPHKSGIVSYHSAIGRSVMKHQNLSIVTGLLGVVVLGGMAWMLRPHLVAAQADQTATP